MTSDIRDTAQPVEAVSGSYVDWPAILLGAVVASALAAIFTAFGGALGLSFLSPYTGEGFATAAIIATALWLLWTTVSTFMVGGYLAGRLRRRIDGATEDEVSVRDGSHGLAVWGVGVLIGMMMLGSAASTTASVAGKTVSAAASGAATVVEGAASATGSIASTAAEAVPMDYISGGLMRSDGTPRAEGELALQQEAKQILVNVLRTGEIPDADREYLVTIASEQTGLDEDTINQRVDDAIAATQDARAQAAEAVESAKDAAAEAEQAARDAAETARIYSIISAFALAAALMIAGAGAYWAAGIGGTHRDEGRVFPHFGRWT